MARSNIPDARKRIMRAAVKLFAENSYEGSRIEAIAKEAGVPKSLIYYHFSSKEEILKVLYEEFIHEYTSLIQAARKDNHESHGDLAGKLRDLYKDFAFRNTDLIRIMFIDSLKKSMDKPVIYQVLEAMIGTEENARSRGFTREEHNEKLVAEFFTGVIPLYAYLCFADSWTDYFQMEKTNFDDIFLRVMTATHGSYHHNSDSLE